MNIYDVLSAAVTNGVQLFLDGDNLGYRAPPGGMTPDLRAAIVACKAELIGFLQAKPSSFSSSSIPRSNLSSLEPAPLSASQQQYWLLNRLTGPSSQYNTHLALQRRGALDVAALKGALDRISERHPSLRTTFPLVDGEPRAVVSADMGIAFSHIDLRHYRPEVQKHAVQRLTRTEQLMPFDHETGPLMRFVVVTLAEDDHRILWTQHHILTDGWSVQIFLRELDAYYEAFSRDRPISLPAPEILYADYARWQNGRHAYADQQSSFQWWKEHLAGLPRLDLPQIRANSAKKATDGDDVSFVLEASLTSRIEALASARKTTPYAVMLAAWTILLHRYSNQKDFAVGTTTHGRTAPELRHVIGSFANAVPMRCDFSGHPTVNDVILRTHTELRAALEHELPFIDVTKAVAPTSRYNGLNPILQAYFIFESVIPGLDAGPSASSSGASSGSFTFSMPERVNGGTQGTTKFDLVLVLMKESDVIRGSLQYSTALFDPALVERLANHLCTLLAQMVSSPDVPVSALDVLSPLERQRILVDWNATGTALGGDDPLHGLFEAQVERTPDARAVVAQGESLTFRELDRRANQLAHYLRERGVGQETLVGICMKTRRIEWVVAMLAIWKAGGAYVPIEAKQPRARVLRLFADAGVRFVVTDEAMTADPLTSIHVDEAAEAIGRQPGTSPGNRIPTHALAYVLFTSGSTGKPKGVGVEHRQLANYVRAIAKRMNLPDGCAYAHVSSLAADLGHTVLFPPLCFGGTLHLVPQPMVTDPEALGRYFEEHAIDCVKIVPSHLSALLSGAHPARVLPRRLLVLGGEALTAGVLEQVRSLAPSLRVLNHYGPTETTVGVLTFDASAPASAWDGTNVPLGRPLANNRAYVVDSELRPVPVGVRGELLIAGAQVTRGYMGPDAPAGKFVPDPFEPASNARAYRTGDWVRQLDSGDIEFLGRIDHQLKIRGFRVEPGEIETVLATHPDIRACVVAPWGDGAPEVRLVAYVVCNEPPSWDELRRHASEWLPDYMVPSQFVFLDAMPLGPNGKIDRSKLSPPAAADTPAAEERSDAPRTPAESTIARIWSDILGVEPLEIDKDFFAVGGNSLLLLTVHKRIQEAFACSIPLVDLFENKTIQSLARKISPLVTDLRVDIESAPAHSSHDSLLVELRAGQVGQAGQVERPPLFLIHSAHGDGPAEYGYLAARLPIHQPVYALRPPPDGLDLCIERLAARYLVAIRSRWSDGPYLLAGASFGGLVAYEMAQQLRHQGDEVGRLMLLDTVEPSRMPSSLDERTSALESKSRKKTFDYLALRSKYRPRPYDGDVVLFRAEKSEVHGFVPHHGGWDSLVRGELRILDTPGGHFTMAQEPHVRVLAEHVASLVEP